MAWTAIVAVALGFVAIEQAATPGGEIPVAAPLEVSASPLSGPDLLKPRNYYGNAIEPTTQRKTHSGRADARAPRPAGAGLAEPLTLNEPLRPARSSAPKRAPGSAPVARGD